MTKNKVLNIADKLEQMLRKITEKHFSVWNLANQLESLINSLSAETLAKIEANEIDDESLTRFLANHINLESALMKNNLRIEKRES